MVLFDLPVDFSRLEDARLRLVPLEDNLDAWAAQYVADANAHPHVYDWLTYGPFADGAAYAALYDATSRPNAHELLLAVVLKGGTVARTDAAGRTTRTAVADGTFAGLAGLVSQPGRATVDLGQLLLTPFQRTFVGTHANALLLHHCLDSSASGGLGLRRVQWQANADNTASIGAAKRLGFRLEGVLRWQQVLPVGKPAAADASLDRAELPRVGCHGEEWGPGRHTAMLSLCWDNWTDGGREHVDALVERVDRLGSIPTE